MIIGGPKIPLINITFFFPLVERNSDLFLDEKNGYITSPNYPGDYPTDVIHTYKIIVDPHFIVRLIIEHLNTEEGYDFVDVSNHN